jgi:hypothetical protein
MIDKTPGRPWTDDENTLFAMLWEDGKTFSQMSEELGRDRAVIHRHSKALCKEGRIAPRIDITRGNGRLWDEGEDDLFATMWTAGSTLKEIGVELGRDFHVVHRHARKLRAEGKIPPRKRGLSQAHIASVQAEQAERIEWPLIKLRETFHSGPVTDRKREVAQTLHAGGHHFKHIAQTLKMTAGQLAIVLRVPAPQGPHADLGKANAMHRLDLMLAYPKGAPTYDIPPEDQARRYPVATLPASYMGSPGATCADFG